MCLRSVCNIIEYSSGYCDVHTALCNICSISKTYRIVTSLFIKSNNLITLIIRDTFHFDKVKLSIGERLPSLSVFSLSLSVSPTQTSAQYKHDIYLFNLLNWNNFMALDVDILKRVT